jgi:hypothetical protein
MSSEQRPPEMRYDDWVNRTIENTLREEGDDGLRAARGIMVGAAFGTLFWLALISVAIRLMGLCR